MPVAIALGSNLGDRLDNLSFGLASLRRHLDDVRISAVYGTVPALVTDQPKFLNACLTGRTHLTARQLLSVLQDAERGAGRRPTGQRWGPRTLDLDLLLYGDRIVHDEHLTLPHPRMRERAFVLVPLAEIAPQWIVPAAGGEEAASVAALLASTKRAGVNRTELVL